MARKQQLREQRIDPRQTNPSELRAIVNWLKERERGEPGRSARAIWAKDRGVKAEDGTIVVKSQGWVYGKVLNPAIAGSLDWIFDDWAVSDAAAAPEIKAVPTVIGAQQQALLKHWEDLRAGAREMASGVRVEQHLLHGTEFVGRWIVSIPEPKEPVARRLWEDLRIHTPGHAAWTLLVDLKSQGDEVNKLQELICEEGVVLGRNQNWSNSLVQEALRRSLENPKPEIVRLKDEKSIDFQRAKAIRANMMREFANFGEYSSAVKHLKDINRQLLDALASLELQHQFEGRCPDCPGRASDEPERS